MKICFATSEIYPFSKAGGLADVSAALGRYLSLNGQAVRIFSPLYATIDTGRHEVKPVKGLADMSARIGAKEHPFSVYSSTLPDSDQEVFLIHCPALYDRPAIYTDGGDEHLRFLLLTRALFECCQRLAWSPDIIHCNDWPTALAPFMRRSIYGWDRLFQETKTVLTIHNIGYQGVFHAGIQGEVTPPQHAYLLHQDDLRQGAVNFLKTGILYADAITTVSPTYAQEIQTDELGAGLQGLLRARSDSVQGILNGVDYDEWSPQRDSYIEKNYSARSPVAGKAKNKAALLERLGLSCGDRVALVAMVTRLVFQKGIDLLFDALPGLLESRDFLFVAIGSGQRDYQEFFHSLQRRFPSKVCFYEGYNNELAHLLEAGADIFLMPSRYEPCGLNQMYSLKYGTVPVVRKTGGLADTVEPWDEETEQGTGFVFEHPTPEGVLWALGQALDTYQDRRAWLKLMRNGMASDFSWKSQVLDYLELYSRLSGKSA